MFSHMPRFSFMLVLFFIVSCSSPPVIRYTVADADFRAVNVTFLGRANSMKADWEAAKKEMMVEQSRTKLLELDRQLAKAWVKAARMQLKRAEATPLVNPGDKNVKPFKSRAQAAKELELAQQHLSLVKRQLQLNRKRLELLKWKVYATQARYLEEVVLALHKAQMPAAGKYSKLKFNDQTHSVQRKFLLREEKMMSLETKVKALEKELDTQWNPTFVKTVGVAKAPCPACPPCPAATPCKCPDAVTPSSKPVPETATTTTQPVPQPNNNNPEND